LHYTVLSDQKDNKKDVIGVRSREEGMQAIHITAAAGNINLCKLLVEKGADLNQFNVYGNT
jgi:ankyrin repeat protein